MGGGGASHRFRAGHVFLQTPDSFWIWGRHSLQRGGIGSPLEAGDSSPGVGKSAALRILSEHLNGLRDLCVGTLTRPQAKMADFYRELGHLFGVPHHRELQRGIINEALVMLERDTSSGDIVTFPYTWARARREMRR